MIARVPFIPQLDAGHDAPHARVWAIVATGDAPPAPGRGHRLRRHGPAHRLRGVTTEPARRAQRTLERASRLAPAGQVVTVMTRRCAPAWDRELAALPPGLRVVQPVYRGRAAEILHALLKIVRRDPAAIVIALPAGQRVDHDTRFLRQVGRAVWAVVLRPDVPLVVGARPDAPVADGWIEPGAPVEGLEAFDVRRVARFVDDASPAERWRLFEDRALVSTAIFVARAETLLSLAGRALPEVRETLEPLEEAFDCPEEPLICEAIYEAMPQVDLGAVQRAPELGVLVLPDAVWRAPERQAPQLLAS
jgi:mannose-1-phosphate guanylyltransferase